MDKLSGDLSCDSCIHKPVCKVLSDIKKVIDESKVVESTVGKSWPLAMQMAVIIGNSCSYYK